MIGSRLSNAGGFGRDCHQEAKLGQMYLTVNGSEETMSKLKTKHLKKVGVSHI
jgi:hypothetical protein